MPMLPTLAELRELLVRNDGEAIRSALQQAHPHAIAERLEELEDEEVWAVLRHLEPTVGADVFSHLDFDRQAELATGRNAPEVATLLDQMASDDRADLVQQLEEEPRQRILTELGQSQRREVEQLATYPEGTVGSVMSTDFVALRADLTAAEAIEYLRAQAARKETIYYNYVVDAYGRLSGIVSLRDLMLADPSEKLSELMNTEVITVDAGEDRTEASRKIQEYDLLALPVVQEDHRLVGIVTVDDVMDVAEEEASEDFDRIAAVGPVHISMGEATFGLLYRKRVPWLLVLVFVNIFSGAGIAYYEQTIEAVVALVFFLPLLIDSGGNAGSQSATLMVRALATGEVKLADWVRLLGREVGVAIALGATMAVGVAIVASFRVDPPDTMDVVMAVSMSMVLIVIVGSLIGMLLPFLFTKINLDPATASGPLVTSLADICGVLIYFGIATMMLREQIAAAAGA